MNGCQIWLCDCTHYAINRHCQMFEAIGHLWSLPDFLIRDDEILLNQGSKL